MQEIYITFLQQCGYFDTIKVEALFETNTTVYDLM